MSWPFEGFAKIERLNQPVTITEKIHGSNAQIYIEGANVLAGSRTRWITPEDDNYGFAKWVQANELLLITTLGLGSHFGEWYGHGINAGYGLKEKRFALFHPHKWKGLQDSPVHRAAGIDVVPVLYAGSYDPKALEDVVADLKTGGSKLVPGYMKPEGIVIRFDRSGVLMKRTFEAEDGAWNYKKDRPPAPDRATMLEVTSPYWQPVRLEKLLSREESFGREYPKSLPALVSAYVKDLEEEVELAEDVAKAVRKGAFGAIKGMMKERGYDA